MRIAISVIALFASLMGSSLCAAQDILFEVAKEELTKAKNEVEKVVVFCKRCKATGRIESKKCQYCDGHGVLLECERKSIEHTRRLKERAERLGSAKKDYLELDIAGRLDKFEEQIEPQAFEMLRAYVRYVKVYQEYQDAIKTEENFAEQAKKLKELLDELIERHWGRLRVPSLRLLYEDDPVGKIGVFAFYGKREKLRIDDKDVERVELRTLKDHSIFIEKTEAAARKRFIVAEIVGKGTYETSDGKEVKGILLHPY